MSKKTERFQYALSTARGITIEAEPERYLRHVRQIRSLDLCEFSLDGLLKRVSESDITTVFAVSAELAARTLDLKPHDNQLVAALAMYDGKLAQMPTGEGKTLAAALAVIPHARAGRSVQIMTANDYLARRDAEWMGPLYRAWGLQVGVVQEGQSSAERKAAYRADITYLTAREAGFDYLRDQLCYDSREQVQDDFDFALVDEADFILIDEARIPLVIAGQDHAAAPDLSPYLQLALELRPHGDIMIDPQGRKLSLTLSGQQKVAEGLGLSGMHHEADELAFARVHAALHARHLLRRDVDYIIQDGRLELVDALTGRIADLRRLPWGIQAAVEAQEGLEVQAEGRIYGSITIQHFLNLYSQLAAMTATAVASAPELSEFYGLSIVVVSGDQPLVRRDEVNWVFASRWAKTEAIVGEIQAAWRIQRPVLVGTASVAESQELADLLTARGIPCAVLNAKNDEREAELIAAAGRLGAVTISTNMAGRGTDIRLQGSSADPLIAEQERQKLLELGGLYIIGTNRHESTRIDDQLRGRSGRQGEPGQTRFIISLEDPLFTRYGVRAFLPQNLEFDCADGSDPTFPAQSINNPVVLQEIDRAQRIIDSQNFDIRKTLRKYSLIVEYDRRYIRMLRDKALQDDELPAELLSMCELGESVFDPLLRRLFLYHLDQFWAKHLFYVEDIREGIHLVQYGGRDPWLEYTKELARAFEEGLLELWETVAEAWRNLPPDADLSSLDQAGLMRPAATWTYLVSEALGPSFTVSMLASANIGVASVAAVPMFIAEKIAWLIRRMLGKA